MAYYVTLYSDKTVDTNLPEDVYSLLLVGTTAGEETIESFAAFRYINHKWSGPGTISSQYFGLLFWAVKRTDYINAQRKAIAVGDYTTPLKSKYLDDGIIKPEGVYKGMPFRLEEESQAEPLTTPTGLYADNITSNSARTNWQAVENASNYKVQYKAAGDTVWTETYTD